MKLKSDTGQADWEDVNTTSQLKKPRQATKKSITKKQSASTDDVMEGVLSNGGDAAGENPYIADTKEAGQGDAITAVEDDMDLIT